MSLSLLKWIDGGLSVDDCGRDSGLLFRGVRGLSVFGLGTVTASRCRGRFGCDRGGASTLTRFTDGWLLVLQQLFGGFLALERLDFAIHHPRYFCVVPLEGPTRENAVCYFLLRFTRERKRTHYYPILFLKKRVENRSIARLRRVR